MDTYKDAVVLNDLWARGRGALDGSGTDGGERRREPGAGHRRPRLRRLAPGAGAARARRRRSASSTGPTRAKPTSAARAAPASTCSGSRDEVELVEADLRDAEAVDAAVAGCDSVFHLAAQTIVGVARDSPLETLEVNVRGAWNVFEACRAHEVGRVVFASSDKAYGASPELPYREDFPLRAAYPYDASKAAADIVARSYAHAYGLPLAVTRFANIYGGGDLNFSRLIPETVVAVLDGRPPVIRSDGSPERDFLHVDDAVSAYLAIAARARRRTGRPARPSTPAASGRTRCARWST